MVHTISLMGSGPTVFLYIISLGDRYTERDRGFYERLKALLGQHLSQYIIIIFTRGDDLKRKHETIDVVLSTAPGTLKGVLNECGDRYIVFDNTADDKQTQVSHLMQEVHKLSQMYGAKPYTCPSYSKKGEKMEEEVARILRKVDEVEVKGKPYVQELEEKTKHAQEEAERNKKEFERNKIKLAELTFKDFEERIEHLESISSKTMECLQKLSTSDEDCQKWIDKLIKMEADRSKQMKDIKRMLKDKIKILEQTQELQQKQLQDLHMKHMNVMIQVDSLMSEMREMSQNYSDKRHTHTRSSVQMSRATVPKKGSSKQIKDGDKRKQAQEEEERETDKSYRQIEPMRNTAMNERDPTAFDKNNLKDTIEKLTFKHEREGAVECLAEIDKDKDITDFDPLRQENLEAVQSKHEKSQDLCEKYPLMLKMDMKSINQPQVDHPLQVCRPSEGKSSQLYSCPDGEVGEVSEKMTEVAGSMLDVKEGLEISKETQELVEEEKQSVTVTVKDEAVNDKTTTNIEVKMEEIRRRAEEREKQKKQMNEIFNQLASKRVPEINKKEDEMQVL